MPVRKKSLDTPDETRKFENGKFEVVTLGRTSIGRGTFEPGWKWSKSVKPIVKTKSCQQNHRVYVVSGRMKIHMDDGSETEVSAGDLASIPAGHDAWILGKEACVVVELLSAPTYAKKTK